MDLRNDSTRAAVVIDGSLGEGGGQVLRSSLALSLVTGRPVHLHSVRAGRAKPGLMRQHLAAVQLAAAIGAARVSGAEVGSREIDFAPQTILAGRWQRAIGSAGSTTLVAQTVLPALLVAEGESELVLEGGTHNPLAPPFDFLARSFVPALRAMGAELDVHLVRHGFHPAGGGELRVRTRGGTLGPLEILARGELRAIRAQAIVAGLPAHVGERELAVVQQKLGIAKDRCTLVMAENGPGNVLTIDLETEAGIEVVTAFGRLGLPAERVAAEAVRDAKAFLRAPAPVGAHLADQLLLPLALAGGGSFRTLRPTTHTTTNARVIEAFLPVRIDAHDEGDGVWRVDVIRVPG